MSIHSFRRIQGLGGLAVSAIALTLSSCTSPTAESTESTVSDADGEIQVVTTFLPMTQFTQAVAGDRAQVTQLLPANVSPHDFQAKPGDVQAIATADVLVENGLSLEFFLEDLIDNADNADLAVIDSSEGIKQLAFDAHAEDEEHDHAEDEEHSEDEDHDHAEDEEHDHGEDEDHEDEAHDHAEDEAHDDEAHKAHEHGDIDPHIWLDPKRAILQVENIRDGLIAADPAGEAEYTANASSYIEQLNLLDQEITEKLAPYAGQTFISFHDFAAYFADSYDLNVEFLVDVPEDNPSPEDVRRVVDTVKSEDIKALLTESAADDTGFDSLAKDLNIQVGVFNPIAVGSPDSTGSGDYVTVMRQNVENLEAALGES